jgi:hypothetical protein
MLFRFLLFNTSFENKKKYDVSLNAPQKKEMSNRVRRQARQRYEGAGDEGKEDEEDEGKEDEEDEEEEDEGEEDEEEEDSAPRRPPKAEYKTRFEIQGYLERYAHFHGVMLVRVSSGMLSRSLRAKDGNNDAGVTRDNLVKSLLRQFETDDNLCKGLDPANIIKKMTTRRTFTIFAYARNAKKSDRQATTHQLLGVVVYAPMADTVPVLKQTDVIHFDDLSLDRDLYQKRILELVIICRHQSSFPLVGAPQNTGRFLAFYAMSLAQLQVRLEHARRTWRYTYCVMNVYMGYLSPDLIKTYKKWGFKEEAMYRRGSLENTDDDGAMIEVAAHGDPRRDGKTNLNFDNDSFIYDYDEVSPGTYARWYRFCFMGLERYDDGTLVSMDDATRMFKLDPLFQPFSPHGICRYRGVTCSR